MSKKHPGFGAVQGKIARQQGISKDRAGAILAASSRNASPAAKKRNPRLEKVAGSPRQALAKEKVAYDKRGSSRKLHGGRKLGGK
jgi:hypothetical protein